MRQAVLIAIPIVFLLSLGGIVYALRSAKDARPVCVLDDCPLEITDKDSGSAYVYRLTSRFTVTLDETAYPRTDFSITCTPEGAAGSISNIPTVQAPRYALRFEGVQPGSCELRDRDFFATVTFQSSDSDN